MNRYIFQRPTPWQEFKIWMGAIVTENMLTKTEDFCDRWTRRLLWVALLGSIIFIFLPAMYWLITGR